MAVRIALILFISCFSAVSAASKTTPCSSEETAYRLPCVKHELKIAGEPVLIKVYEKLPKLNTAKLDRTFVVVHNNEQKGLDAAKQVVAEKYGRLVEIVSNYKEGYRLSSGEIAQKNFLRYIYFGDGKYCVDPNRIYTKKGIRGKLSLCETIPESFVDEIYSFGQKLLAIVTKNGTHRLIIGVHNNTTVPGALSVETWQSGSEASTAVGIFKTSDALGQEKITVDEFVLVTNVGLFDQFLAWSIKTKTACNIALQKDRSELISAGVDDGSMSIVFVTAPADPNRKPFSYVNIEAGGKENAPDTDAAKRWQKTVIKFALDGIKP